MESLHCNLECVICLNNTSRNSNCCETFQVAVDKVNSHNDDLLKLLQTNLEHGLKPEFFVKPFVYTDGYRDNYNGNQESCETADAIGADLSPPPDPLQVAAHHNKIYCQACAERNQEISTLITNIGIIFHRLQDLRAAVKHDFESSILSRERSVSETNFSVESWLNSSHSSSIEKRKHALRQQIAKSLHLNLDEHIETDITHDQEQEPASPLSFCNSPQSLSDELKLKVKLQDYSISMDGSFQDDLNLSANSALIGNKCGPKSKISRRELLQNHSNNRNSNHELTELKKLHKLKECSVLVESIKVPRKASLRKCARLTSTRKAIPTVKQAKKSEDKMLTELMYLSSSPSHDMHSTEPLSDDDCSSVLSLSSDAPSHLDHEQGNSDSKSDSEDEEDEAEVYRAKPNKKAIKPGSGTPKRNRKIQNNIKNGKRPPKKKKEKPSYKPLTIHCTHEGCTRKNGFNTENDLEMHIQQVHKGITHPYICTFADCTKTFRENKRLQLHIRSVHLGQFPHICQYCGKGFTITPNLKAHLVTHTKEANFKCREPNCGRVFLSAHGLTYHKRSAHTGERPYRCDRCGKGFFSLYKLYDHIKCVHEKGTGRPFICHQCGKDFPIQKYLYMHMRNSHQKKAGADGVSAGSEQEEQMDPVIGDGIRDRKPMVVHTSKRKKKETIRIPKNDFTEHINIDPIDPLMITKSDTLLSNMSSSSSFASSSTTYQNPLINPSTSTSTSALQLQQSMHSVLSSHAAMFSNSNQNHHPNHLAGFSHIPPFNNYR